MNWNFAVQNDLAAFIDEAEKNTPQRNDASKKVSFAEKMKQRRKDLSEISNSVFAKVWGNESEFQKFLTMVEHLNLSSAEDSHGRGIVNAALVYAQRPEARRLLTFEEWSKKGVRIKKGSQGIDIFIPATSEKDGKRTTFFNPTKVYDVEQTTAQFKAPVFPEVSDHDVIGTIAFGEFFYIEYSEKLPDGVDACYIPRLNEVRVRDGQSQEAMRESLLIEFGHSQLAKSKGYVRSPEAQLRGLYPAPISSPSTSGLEMEPPPPRGFPCFGRQPWQNQGGVCLRWCLSATKVCSSIERAMERKREFCRGSSQLRTLERMNGNKQINLVTSWGLGEHSWRPGWGGLSGPRQERRDCVVSVSALSYGMKHPFTFRLVPETLSTVLLCASCSTQ